MEFKVFRGVLLGLKIAAQPTKAQPNRQIPNILKNAPTVCWTSPVSNFSSMVWL